MSTSRTFKRDKRSPIPLNERTSEMMSAIKAKDTKPELVFRRYLWSLGLRGYRLHPSIPGRPDISYQKCKVAIFIHGCYWHRCPKCDLPMPMNNRDFWEQKFNKNQQRDKLKKEQLESMGRTVFTIWECEVDTLSLHMIDEIKRLVRC
jgi:DNA mismatch endonuclease (patch repair protein)